MLFKKLTTALTGTCISRHYSLVRKAAPQFTAKAVVNGEFKQIKSSNYHGKYWMIFFYPLDFTFVCPTEIIAFNEKLDEFKKLGCEVLAASVDSEFSHLAWTRQSKQEGGLGPIRLPIISDITKQISRDFGVLIEDSGIALRGLFLIDQKGIVRHETINDTGIGRSVDEALRILQALQHTEQFGEVCPANWSPGASTIDPKNASKYFSSLK